jgi:hypothetical protein
VVTNRWQSTALFLFLVSCSAGPRGTEGWVAPSQPGDAGDTGDGSLSDDAGNPDLPPGEDAETPVDPGPDGSVDPRPDGSIGPPPPSDFPLDAVQMRGTHNSYHSAPSLAFDDSHKYTHVPLDQQLGDQGVRVLELDLHQANTDDSIDVYHIVGIDSGTTCNDFEACLRTVRGWSEAHPRHVPVIVWVEVKDDTGGAQFENLDKVDEVLRAELGDRLLTPDQLQGDAPSLHDAIATRGWPTVDSLRGKFMFVVLSQDADIDSYSSGWSSLAGRAMFVRVNADRFTSSVAVFAKLGIGEPEVVKAAHDAKLMIATNVCGVNDSDEHCEAQRVSAIAQGFHMLKDDLPAPITGRNYFMALPEGKPVACNPVRAPEGCTPEALEQL